MHKQGLSLELEDNKWDDNKSVGPKLTDTQTITTCVLSVLTYGSNIGFLQEFAFLHICTPQFDTTSKRDSCSLVEGNTKKTTTMCSNM